MSTGAAEWSIGAASKGAVPLPASHLREEGLEPQYMMEIQRTRILAAMVEVCRERGPANVTIAHVVERAGVSRRTFYEIYKDREECFLAAFDDGIARARRYVLESYDPEAKWVLRVRLALSGLLAFLDVERGVGQLLIVGSLGGGHQALHRRQRVVAKMIALIDEGASEAKANAELPPLTADGVVGGVLSVLHGRLVEAAPGSRNTDPSVRDRKDASLVELVGPLTSMIVLPYLGPAAACRELARPVSVSVAQQKALSADPLRGVPMRLTYRTVRVLMAVASLSDHDCYPSNREVGTAADMRDQGQISRLLTRLTRIGLIENSSVGRARGGPNAWMLTPRGREIEQALRESAAG